MFRVVVPGQPDDVLKVEAVIGGGRLNGGATQTFFSADSMGRLVMLPFDYSVTDKRWFCQTKPSGKWLPIDRSLSIKQCEYPARRHLGVSATANCQNCHGSQITLEYDREQKAFTTGYTELSINCEGCHGPGAKHSQSGSGPEAMSLTNQTRDESVRTCFRCHADKSSTSAGYVMGHDGRGFFTVLSLRAPDASRVSPDGRIKSFSYQETHLWSDCFQNGSMTCIDCHEPHTNGYRDVFGKALNGRFDDGQCTGCHPSKIEGLHSRHPSGNIRCVDCHMPYRQHPSVGTKITYRRSDHSISIPRPIMHPSQREGQACAACHQDKSTAWVNHSLKDLFGALKPKAAGVDELARLSATVPPGGRMNMRPPNRLTEAETVVQMVDSKHWPAVTSGLSIVLRELLTAERPRLTKETRQRVVDWMEHSEEEVSTAALAAGLLAGIYHPELRKSAFDVLLKGTYAKTSFSAGGIGVQFVGSPAQLR